MTVPMLLVAIATLCSAPASKPALPSKAKPASGKVVATKKDPSATKAEKPGKQDLKNAPVAPSKIQDLDRICRRDLSWGKVQAVRDRCSDLEPKSSAIATFWRLSLSDDPNDLRKGFAPAGLAKAEVDSRLLLAAGRYHFARGQRKEMEDLVEIARKAKIAAPEIDTLKRLAAGK